MSQHALAGQPVPQELRVDVGRLLTAYGSERPDPAVAAESVSFGTSGHRGSSLRRSFNEAHIRAIARAVAEYRNEQGTIGPLYLGADTHALSGPALASAVEVLRAEGVLVLRDADASYTPTPVISHAILRHNHGHQAALADGIVITPSHNPPEDGGIKYNPPTGGPADTAATTIIERRANELLRAGGPPRTAVPDPSPPVASWSLTGDYVKDLGSVLDMDAISASGVRIGVDPLGGSSLKCWELIADRWRLNLELVNERLDPSFSFMTLDWDGRIRMDCSSGFAMAGLIGLKDRYDVAIGNDPDADRHGIVTPSAGLLNPNHYLVAAVWYLCRNRPRWRADAGSGKTLGSSAMIDRGAAHLRRPLAEVPGVFKWFVPGLLSGSLAFGGEESAGASFVRRDGSVWTTDKDGILLGLLAAEMTAREERDPGELYAVLEERFGSPAYERVDAPASPAQKAALKRLAPEHIAAVQLAGDPIVARLTHAPGNGEAIGGIKVATAQGWFAARPSGTEEVYKIYAESFRGEAHLRRIQEEAVEIVAAAFAAGGGPA
ncbi:MAG: alpha-D-glucose phosphate-specific phosphoglucomutase [Gemmatimonadetes bacterium]|nr:alpha-D-glucose phosphate-specific phosphoglucomutase [Gemmatimonadota bacterium]